MNRKTRLMLSILSSIVFIALAGAAIYFFRKTPIGEANALKDKARKEYFAREFLSAYKTYQRLIDSLQIQDDAASINYANAAFMSSNILKNGLYGRSGNNAPLSDTVLQMLAGISQEQYNRMTGSTNRKIASIAYNQKGYSAIKGNEEFSSGNQTDSLLFMALEDFKQALKQNPNNDSARYNYELIKKIVGFPETILAETRALVAQKKYVEAANLLERSMQRDVRLIKQKDLLNRIKSVAGIDTTFKTRRL